MKEIAESIHTSMSKEAINYRVELARASNAVEGVEFSEEEKAKIDSISIELSDEELANAVVRFVNGDN